MAENEAFIRQASKTKGIQGMALDLITRERAQKFELLVHLIANLRQSLVVCGPKGIGKTTLLTILKERASPEWHCHYINGSQQLSFESIQAQLALHIKQDAVDFKTQGLSGYFARLAQQNQKLVLIIDDAGLLVPGLIDTLARYALGNSALRIIFALTQDELYVKSSSDRTVDECHFIDLPPLSEKQCGEFLQNLSGKPDAVVSFSAINDNMIAHLYQETHGIPGRIMAALPHLSEYGQVRVIKWGAIAVLAALLIAGSVYWLWQAGELTLESSSSTGPSTQSVVLRPPKLGPKDEFERITESDADFETNVGMTDIIESTTETPSDLTTTPLNEVDAGNIAETATKAEHETVADAPKIVPVESAQQQSKGAVETDVKPMAAPSKTEAEPVVAAESVIVPPSRPQTESAVIEKPTPVVVKPVLAPSVPTTKEASVAARTADPVEAVSAAEQADADADDKAWLFKQSPNNYTLQIMAVSHRQSLLNLIKKHSALKASLKYVKTVSNNKTKYLLLYGSFNRAALADNAMQKLPKEFRKSWVRRIKSVQNDVK